MIRNTTMPRLISLRKKTMTTACEPLKRVRLALMLTAFLAACLSSPADGMDSPSVIYAVGPPSSPVYEPGEGPIGWKGLFVDIAEEIFVKELGCRLVVEQYPWKRAQQSVKQGLADFTVSVPTADRLEYALQSEKPILKMDLNVYTYAGHPKFREIARMHTVEDIVALELKPVTNLGNGWHKENIEDAGVATVHVPNDENLVQFLALKRADIMIDAPIFVNRLIEQYKLNAKIVRTEATFGPINFHLLVSKNSHYADLMPKIDSVIEKLVQNGTLERITGKYTR